MHIFEKLPQILGLCPLVKFRITLEKSDPQTFCGPPSTEKSCINYCFIFGIIITICSLFKIKVNKISEVILITRKSVLLDLYLTLVNESLPKHKINYYTYIG